jgi:hypothetical protein
MKERRKAFGLLLSAGALCLWLNALPARAESPSGVINVVGVSERLVRPDLAHLEITIDVRGDKLDRARLEAGSRTSEVLRSLKEIGITDDSIDSGSLIVQPEFVWEPKSGARRLQGYHVGRTIRVRLIDLDKLGTVLERAVKSGANQISPPRFALHSEGELRRELLTDATRDARRNAAAIAAGLEAQLGAVLRVDAIEADPPIMASPIMLRASVAATEDAAAEQSYRPGDMTLRVQVKASFAIAP